MKKFLTFILAIFVLLLTCNNLYAAGTPKKGTVKDNVKNNVLKVRKKPNAKNKKYVGELKIGTNVNITKVSGKWYKIKVSDTKGWVKKKYIKVTEYDYSEKATVSSASISSLGSSSISGSFDGSSNDIIGFYREIKMPTMGKSASKMKAKKVESKEDLIEEDY